MAMESSLALDQPFSLFVLIVGLVIPFIGVVICYRKKVQELEDKLSKYAVEKESRQEF